MRGPVLTDEDDETHREATETTKTVDEQEFDKVVDRRVDPSTTLRHENFPFVRCDSLGLGVSSELELVLREVLQSNRVSSDD